MRGGRFLGSIPPSVRGANSTMRGRTIANRAYRERPAKSPPTVVTGQGCLEKAWEKFIERKSGEIGMECEVQENCDDEGRLGVILQFSGISIEEESPVFRESRDDNETDSSFFIKVEHNGKSARLILTTREDILEVEVVPETIREKPHLQEEIFLTELSFGAHETHDPGTMSVGHNNGVCVVSYDRS